MKQTGNNMNRTGTYFAFDGLGQTDPSKSDFRYYAVVQGWDSSKSINFKFTDSHDKASAVRDTSKRTTLEASIRKRLSGSKNMVVLISKDTRESGSMLSYEIEMAVDYYKLPLIIAYTEHKSILDVSSHSNEWPKSLRHRISNDSTNAIHIPFKKEALFDAVRRFTVNGEDIGGSRVHYDKQSQVSWGYIR